jgi:hypothetical protein
MSHSNPTNPIKADSKLTIINWSKAFRISRKGLHLTPKDYTMVYGRLWSKTTMHLSRMH